MFSQLGPLFKTTFRKTETNDTRLHIPHEERERNQKKSKDDQKKNNDSDPWEDNANVTVDALKQFLINFLRTLPGYSDTQNLNSKSEEIPISNRPHEKTRPTNTKNAKAVRAYQAIAEKNSTTNSSDVLPPKSDQNVEPTADLLESKELRDIHELIKDLDDLKAENIKSLEIKAASSFLESLKNAVKIQKSKI